MPSYSKFAILSATNTPSFIPYGEQSVGLLDQHSLSNSEPSVAEFDAGNGSEPLMPYCKFGLARSAGNGLNQPLSVNPKVGYSKFGTVYRALKQQDNNNISLLNGDVHSYHKFVPHNPQTFTALTVSNPLENKQLPLKETDKAYSKFGVSNSKNTPVNGYVCFKDTLSYPTADSGTAYSKVGVTANKTPAQTESEPIKENGVIINAAELQALRASSQVPHLPCGNSKDVNFSASKDSLEEDDKDIILDSSPSLLDEITSNLGMKLKPTNCTISANNDTKGVLLQDESSTEPANQLTDIMDALFGKYDFHIADGSLPITINMEDLDITNPSDDYCEHCSHSMSDCTCSESTDRTDIICNGHASLPNSSDYVQVGCKPAC